MSTHSQLYNTADLLQVVYREPAHTDCIDENQSQRGVLAIHLSPFENCFSHIVTLTLYLSFWFIQCYLYLPFKLLVG